MPHLQKTFYLKIFYQDHADPSNIETRLLKDTLVFCFAVHGTMMILIEITCYFILYHHIYSHDVNIAALVLDSSVIRKRHQVNAVSLTGLFAGWLMEVWYVVFVGIIAILFKNDSLYEMSTFCKVYAYYLVPIVQVSTSALLRRP